MKKLLVLVLSAIMVLSIAAVSMAAVTVGGEFEGYYKFGLDAYDNNPVQDKSTIGTDAQDMKVTVKADLNDSVTAFAAIKNDFGTNDNNANVFFDESWFSLKTDFATFKFGYFGYGFGGKKDILDIYMRDLKATMGTEADFTVGEGMTLSVFYALDGQNGTLGDPTPAASVTVNGNTVNFGQKGLGDGAFAVTFGYANDTFGGGISVADYAQKKTATNGVLSDLDTGIALNFFYNLAPVQFYFVYDTIKYKDNVSINGGNINSFVNEIIGVSYAPADSPLYARFEYDLDDNSWAKDIPAIGNAWSFDKNTKWNAWGAYVGYKFTDGIKLQYMRKQTGKEFAVDTNELKVVVDF